MLRRPEPSVILVGLALIPLVMDVLSSRQPDRAPPPLPVAGRGFTGRDEPLTTEERLLLGRVPATKKLYSIGANRVLVLSLDASVDRHVIHEPTYCLQGKGWHIARDEERAIAAGRVRLLGAEHKPGGHLRRSVSFYQAGDRWYTSRWTYLIDFLRARWWPGETPPLRHVVVLCTDRRVPGEDWLSDTVLPLLLGAQARAH